MLLLTLRLVHIVAMTLWFAAGVFANSDIRRGFANPVELPGLRIRMKKTGIFAIIGGVLTIVTGLGLIFAVGGFGAVPWPIHAAFALTLVQAGIGGGLIGGTWAKIEAGLQAGASPESLAPLCGRIYTGGAIFHALWTINLVLMVFRHAL